MKETDCITSNVIFIGNARCFHTMDWYRSAQDLLSPKKVLLVTDLIHSEGHAKLVNETDNLIHLYNIDWLLLRRQSKFGNIWRNVIKALFLPIQVWRLKLILRKIPHLGKILSAMSCRFPCFRYLTLFFIFSGSPKHRQILPQLCTPQHRF